MAPAIAESSSMSKTFMPFIVPQWVRDGGGIPNVEEILDVSWKFTR